VQLLKVRFILAFLFTVQDWLAAMRWHARQSPAKAFDVREAGKSFLLKPRNTSLKQ
jgi:hypothetical protein